jgi:MarR family transcriptional regulator, temperature-dependent positive regulator of motility
MDILGNLVSRVALAWQLQANRVLRATGLTYVQFQLLAALANATAVTQAAVARQAGVDAMTASLVMRSLERRRYVTRRVSAADSRARDVALTTAGTAVLERARPLIADAEARFFAGVAADRAQLAAVLGLLIGQRVRLRVPVARRP